MQDRSITYFRFSEIELEQEGLGPTLITKYQVYAGKIILNSIISPRIYLAITSKSQKTEQVFWIMVMMKNHTCLVDLVRDQGSSIQPISSPSPSRLSPVPMCSGSRDPPHASVYLLQVIKLVRKLTQLQGHSKQIRLSKISKRLNSNLVSNRSKGTFLISNVPSCIVTNAG